jgi:hypothetical protein
MFEIEKVGGFYVLDLTNYVGCSYNNMGRPTRASIPISLLDAKLSHISLANNYWQEPKGIQLVYPNKDIVWPNGLVEDSIKDLCGDGGVIMPVIFNIREMFRFPQPISGEQERT